LSASRHESADLVPAIAAVLGPLRPPVGDLTGMAEACSVPSPKCIRLNLQRGSQHPVDLPFRTRPVPWFPHAGRWVTDSDRPGGHLLYGTGAYYVQDAGSLLAVAAMNPLPGDLICDLCASPGGKTVALLDQLGPTGGVLANETVRSRLPPLLLNLARHGGTRFGVANLDPEHLAERAAGRFDGVLVDAPCSGQSLVARGRQGARAYHQRTIRHCAARQRRILTAAARLVRPSGYMVYSTCTFSWAENEQQVMDFLDRNRDWSIEPLEALSRWQSPPPAPQGSYRLWPHLDGSAGAFACRLRHSGPGFGNDSPNPVRGHFYENFLPLSVGRWESPVIVRCTSTRCEAWPEDIPALLPWIGASGPAVAFRRGKTWFPAYDLAMRRDGSFTPDRSVELNEEQAVAYLQGQPIEHCAIGWTVVRYKGWALGWGHGSGRRLANHLPVSARITRPYA